MAELKKQRPMTAIDSWVSWIKDPTLTLTFAVVFSLDQITKAIVRDSLFLGESIPSDGFFRITRTFNTGTAFGLFPDQTLVLILASLVGVAILIFLYRRYAFSGLAVRLSLGMQLGGALGNLVDRLRMGKVTDFIDVGPWPIFNIADTSIVIGILILVWLFTSGGKESKEMRTQTYSGGQEHTGFPEDFWSSDLGEASVPDKVHVNGQESDAPTLCPECSSVMDTIPNGSECPVCGVREWRRN